MEELDYYQRKYDLDVEMSHFSEFSSLKGVISVEGDTFFATVGEGDAQCIGSGSTRAHALVDCMNNFWTEKAKA
jgi:hypothetical protein